MTTTKTRWLLKGAALFVSVALAGSAQAQDKPMREIMHDRHENFEKMGEAFEHLEKEVKKRKPNWTLMQKNAAEIRALSAEQVNWFPAGSGPESGIKTKAKAEVWSQPEEFKRLYERFIVEAVKLDETAARSDVAAMAAQVHTTGEVCSACHEKFRKQGGLLSIFGG